MYVFIWMCDVDYISVRVPPHMWRICAVSMTTQSMWSQVIKEEEMRDERAEKINTGTSEPYNKRC